MQVYPIYYKVSANLLYKAIRSVLKHVKTSKHTSICLNGNLKKSKEIRTFWNVKKYQEMSTFWKFTKVHKSSPF